MPNLKVDIYKHEEINLGSLEEEIKIALVIDSYKIKHKSKLWSDAMMQKPDIEKYYKLDREKTKKGPMSGCLTLHRVYKLKPEFKVRQ